MQVLIDIVGIEQWRGPEGGEQILGDGFDERLRVASLGEAFEQWGVGLLPLGEKLGHGVDEGSELGMAEYGGLHLGDGKLELAVASAIGRS